MPQLQKARSQSKPVSSTPTSERPTQIVPATTILTTVVKQTLNPLTRSPTVRIQILPTTETTKKPRLVYLPCKACGKSNHPTEKVYFGANAANRRPEREYQVQQRDTQIANERTQAATRNLNQKSHACNPWLPVTDQRPASWQNFQQFLRLCGSNPRRHFLGNTLYITLSMISQKNYSRDSQSQRYKNVWRSKLNVVTKGKSTTKSRDCYATVSRNSNREWASIVPQLLQELLYRHPRTRQVHNNYP